MMVAQASLIMERMNNRLRGVHRSRFGVSVLVVASRGAARHWWRLSLQQLPIDNADSDGQG